MKRISLAPVRHIDLLNLKPFFQILNTETLGGFFTACKRSKMFKLLSYNRKFYGGTVNVEILKKILVGMSN